MAVNMDNETLHEDNPASQGTLARFQDGLVKDVLRAAAHERAVLNQMEARSVDGDSQAVRTDALYRRRLEVEMRTTANIERDRTARKYIMVAATVFILIPALGLLNTNDMYLSANQGSEWLFGYNWTFAYFIGLLSLVLILAAKAALLVFEPWLSSRLKSADPRMATHPQVRIHARPLWRVRWVRIPGSSLSLPIPKRYFRVLPVTEFDVLAAALEHIQASETAPGPTNRNT